MALLPVGYVGGSFDYDNAYENFVTAPQIYTPTAPLGQRWSNLLTDSGIDRGYHNSALLIASGEVWRNSHALVVYTLRHHTHKTHER